MKFTFITNACCIYESNNFKLLCDPWLSPGAFYGSWFQYPPLKTKPEDVADYDALYISHLHPDHFDPETLKHFDKTKPVIILDRDPNYLERMVRREGFGNIAKLKDGETLKIGPFIVTMFGPFCGHPFFETELGNLIDSAIVVDDGSYKIFNANDNTPDLKSAQMLKDRFGSFDIAQLNYNAAGPYPSCFKNLSFPEKVKAHTHTLKRNLNHVVELCGVLEPGVFMPFAGAYMLGGRNWAKNEYLGTTTPEFAAGFVQMESLFQDTLILKEGESYELGSELRQCFYAQAPYDYDTDSLPAIPELDYLIKEATKNLRKYQDRFQCYPEASVLINGRYQINLSQEGLEAQNYLKADLDPALLHGILTGKYHWNNAEIGCHIEFYREPDVYLPDVHLLMSFLHV